MTVPPDLATMFPGPIEGYVDELATLEELPKAAIGVCLVRHQEAVPLLRELVTRAAEQTEEYIYHGAYGPRQTPLSGMVRVVATRWAIGEGLKREKGEVGLDQYEVRRWDAWHRHITLSLLAHAALQVTRARPKSGGEHPGPA